MIISITGDLGSGKSTVSKILKERLNYEYIYTGKIQRDLADRYNMTILELNKYAETHPEIDEEIDSIFKSLNDLYPSPTLPKGEEAVSGLIVDSRLAWFFIPKSFKVYLKTDVEVAAKRISHDKQRKSEKYISQYEAINDIIARKESENKRYLELYGADCSNLSNFNLVIDCSYITPEKVADSIIEKFNAWRTE